MLEDMPQTTILQEEQDNEEETLKRSQDERHWGTLCHLSVFLGYLIPYVGNFLGPVVIWYTQKDKYPYVVYNAKEALNFQITMLLISLAYILLVFFTHAGLFLSPVLLILSIGFPVWAAIKTAQGTYFRYPISLRLIKI